MGTKCCISKSYRITNSIDSLISIMQNVFCSISTWLYFFIVDQVIIYD